MAKGKVISMNEKTKEVGIEIKGKKENFKVGKKIFNGKKFRIGDTIEFELKGSNFEFKKVTHNQKTYRNGNKNNNKNKLLSTKQYPYNFVSLGEEREKSERELGENTGKLVCKLKTLSPLFIMGKKENRIEYFYRENGIHTISASSLKGAIRNIIDTLTGSPIRNVDGMRLDRRILELSKKTEFSRKFDLVFGIVNSLPENGKDGEIIEAEKIKVMIMEKNSEWKQNEYKDKCKEYTDTYDENGLIEKIMLKEEIYRYIKDKINDEIRHPSEYKDLLSSDKNSGIKGIFWFSPLIHKKRYEKILIPKEKGKKFKFSEQEYKDFKHIIKQIRKRLKKDKDYNSSYYEEELKKGNPILCLFEEENEEKKVHLAFSEVPRLRYKLSPLNLVPPEFRPSNSLEKLSFSEKLFGTTGNHHENTSKEKENKKMTSMSGRVFFSDAKICAPDNPKMVKNGEAVTLKPFGEPHPTLFDFYLYKGDYDNLESRIRGRKFYWHHKDKINNDYKNYGKSIEAEKRKTNSDFELMNYGNEFEFEVYFERLTDEELGVLIYGLELEEDMAHKIGKGKAFGFGSSKIIIEKLLFENKEKKYKCFSKEEIYENQKKEKFLRIAKEKYITEEDNIKELKAILNIENKIENTKNDLDFSKSPFPEEIGKKGEKNTLNWFMNNKGIKLLKILDEFGEKKNDNNKN